MTNPLVPHQPVVVANPWETLRRFTAARIALGRAGGSLPTAPHLAFQLAHAQARDAVQLPLNQAGVASDLQTRGYQTVRLHSAAPDRATYLQRPDLGRRLAEPSRETLAALAAHAAAPPELAFVIGDGLSARAIHENAVAFLDQIAPRLIAAGWHLGPVSLVAQARVAIGDEIGQVLGAAIVVILIGERPGLSSPDSLGAYLTYGPRIGVTDAQRNCISNIRAAGLSHEAAAHKLAYLLDEARRRKLSGVLLKDEAGTRLPLTAD